jgi:hypothetical protein
MPDWRNTTIGFPAFRAIVHSSSVGASPVSGITSPYSAPRRSR